MDNNETDGRTCDLPKAAVNLAARITQLSRERPHGVTEVRVIIIGTRWFLRVEGGKIEEIGRVGP